MNKYIYRQYMEKKAISPLFSMLGGATAGGAIGTGATWWNGDDNYARNAIVSIKAFTDDIDYLLDVQVNSIGNNDDVIDVELSINANNVFKEDVSFVVKN